MAEKHLDQEQILALLEGTSETLADDSTWNHLKTCRHCQASMTRIAKSHGLSAHELESWRTGPDQVVETRPHHEDNNSLGITVTGFAGKQPVDQAGLAKDAIPGQIGQYKVLGEIARGGMGVVVRAEDPQFGRELAIKISLQIARMNPDAAARFDQEAQLTGQLQHPGIPPVHRLGQLQDGRPYFVMKLVAGQTLSRILAKQDRNTRDISAAVRIFEQICQTVGYAHSQQIVHRDIKPMNIMVGEFGEVQVMDWGLAKNLSAAGSTAATPESNRPSEIGSGQEPQRVASVTPTLAGTIMGTPAYMAPEQARGDVDQVDKRSDVYGLGAVMCQILTGEPPYRGRNMVEVLDQVKQGDHCEVNLRLDQCGADQELIDLAKRSLSFSKDDRPDDASVLAKAIAGYRENVSERLRQTELKQAQAEVQFAEERKRRIVERQRQRLRLTVAVMFLVAVVAGAAGMIWYKQHQATLLADQTARDLDRTGRQQRIVGEVQAALSEAEKWNDQVSSQLEDEDAAIRLLSSIQQWRLLVDAANSSATRADTVARADIDLLPEEIHQDLIATRKQTQQHVANFQIAESLDRAREKSLEPGLKMSYAQAAYDYGTCFEENGLLAVTEADIPRVVERIRESSIRAALVAALDHWATLELMGVLRGSDLSQAIGRSERLLAVARGVDDDGKRNQLRDVVLWMAEQKKLVELTQTIDIPRYSPQQLDAIAFFLPEQEAIRFRRRALLVYPEDFFLTHNLAMALEPSTEKESWFHAALAIRPKSAVTWLNLSYSLAESEKWEEACVACNQALAIAPDYGLVWNNLGNALASLGKTDEAIEAHRRAIELTTQSKDLAKAYANLGLALMMNEELEEAAEVAVKAIDLDPKFANGHNILGGIYLEQQKFEEAIPVLEVAAKLDSRHNNSLAEAFRSAAIDCAKRRDYQQAIPLFQRSVQLEPDDVDTLFNLGVSLSRVDRKQEALEQLERASELDPQLSGPAMLAGTLLFGMRKIKPAISKFRAAIEADANNAEAYYSLAVVLQQTGELNEPLKLYGKAVELDDQHGWAFFNMGTIHLNQDQPEKAIPLLRKSAELMPDEISPLQNLGKALSLADQQQEAEQVARKVLEMQPGPAAHAALGVSLLRQERFSEAEAQYRKALDMAPQSPIARRGLAFALYEQEKFPEALEAFEYLIKRDPGDMECYRMIAMIHRAQNRADDAIATIRQALQQDDADLGSLRILAQLLQDQPSLESAQEAVLIYQRIVELNPNDVAGLNNLAGHYVQLGDLPAAERTYQTLLKTKPDDWPAHENLALVLERQGRFKEAVKVYHHVISAQPDRAKAHWWLGLALKKDQQLVESRQALQAASKLQPGNAKLASDLKQAERWIEFERIGPALIAGDKNLDGPKEWVDFAEFCYDQHKYRGAMRAYQQALQDKSKFSNQDAITHMYNAACCAALCMGGKQSKVEPPADREKDELRKQALSWLQSALDLCLNNDDREPGLAEKNRSRLGHWLVDPDLERLRDPQARSQIPNSEQKEWEALWSRVAQAAGE